MEAPTPEQAAALLEASFSSRRSFVKGAVATGLAVAGAGILASPVFADPAADAAAAIKSIFTVARTAEQLAVTFYTNGILNSAALKLTDLQIDILKAALIEEQIHQTLFVAQGGDSLADTFSFPDGPSTFTDLGKFIKAQQQLEGVFDSAFLAAVKQFASPPISNPALAQIAAQIAMIESEHRALGRDIGGLDPGANWAYAPIFLAKVEDAPAVVKNAGYLSPVAGNSYKYAAPNFMDPSLSGVFARITNQTPSSAQAA